MAAPKGNNYNKKYKTTQERKEVCKKFCDHVAAGFSIDSFPDCAFKTIKSYIEEFPKDFPPDMISSSKRHGIFFWEKVGIDGTTGKIKGFNPSSWMFNMKNRYRWTDRQDHTTDDKPLSINVISYAKSDDSS